MNISSNTQGIIVKVDICKQLQISSVWMVINKIRQGYLSDELIVYICLHIGEERYV